MVDFKHGDFHNFGQRVSLVPGIESLRVFKPRTLFWEFLFLDASSPLRHLLRKLKQDTPLNFDKLLGAIQIFPQDQFGSGEVAFFQVKAPPSITHEWLHMYGQILAFASVFGITDLHRENAIVHANGIQLLDIECVFWNIELPSETFLLPRTNEELGRSVLHQVGVRALNNMTAKEVEAIISGVEEVILFFRKYSQDLQSFFIQQEKEVKNHPIRILAKRTQEYRDYLDGCSAGSFFKEEVEQLERNDIPYFFGYMDHHKVYYFVAPNEAQKTQSTDLNLDLKVRRAFKNPVSLLSTERLVRLQKQIIVEITRRLLDLKYLPYNSGKVLLERDQQFINIKTTEFSLRVNNKGIRE